MIYRSGKNLPLRPSTPLYERPTRNYKAVEILDLLICGVPEERMCTERPTGIRTTSSFVIDTTYVHFKDIGADDNGSWSTSYPRRCYTVEIIGGHVIAATPCQTNETFSGARVYTLCRQYGIHKGTSDFRRIIAHVIDESSCQVIPRVLLHYFFKSGKEEPIVIPPHGNSLHNRPYYRTQPSTIKAIQESSSSKSVLKVYDDVFEAAGGLEQSTSMSIEPRNKMQIYNARKLKCNSGSNSVNHGKDELFDLLELLKQHQLDANGGFLREVTLSTSPSAVLASQRQLENLVTFCCQPNEFSVLGIDATFNLGDFYVTLTTYRNFTLRNSQTRVTPVFIGPTFLHMERRTQDYHSFFSSLLRLEPRLSSLKAYGTDGEMAIMNALEACFPTAISLRCFIHVQDNILECLKGSSVAVKKAITRDIFGQQVGDVYQQGLVDAISETEFDEKVALKRESWETYAVGFHEWFVTKQAAVFKKSMIGAVRKAAHVTGKFTNNPNESMNSTIKKWVNFTKSTWPEFVMKLQELMELQLKEGDKAVYGSGEYMLAPSFTKFAIDPNIWHQMKPSQRKEHMKKIHGHTSTSFTATESVPCRSDTSGLTLSIRSDDVSLQFLSRSAVSRIWDKALSLLQTEGLVVSLQSTLMNEELPVTPPSVSITNSDTSTHNLPPDSQQSNSSWMEAPPPRPLNDSSNFFASNWTIPWYPYHPFTPYPSYPYNYPNYPTTTPTDTAPTCGSRNDKQYVVKFLNNRIKKCYGCSSEFTRKIDGSLPDPPLNIVISHSERREFRDANNTLKVGNYQNVYYHPNLSCIRRRNAAFMGNELVISADIVLTESHKKYLQEYFNCFY